MPCPPVSEKQRAANRANASRSTGPRTPEGKARSSRNARRHGFTADHFAVFRLEDVDAVGKLKADLVSVYQPVNAQELFALERIAIAQNVLLRAARLEAGLFFYGINQAADENGNYLNPPSSGLCHPQDMTTGQNFDYALADGFVRMARESDAWRLLFRYQALAERNHRRAIEEFNRLKSLREELPNEPIFDPQPESAQPLAPDPNEPAEPPESPSAPPEPPPAARVAVAAPDPARSSARGSAPRPARSSRSRRPDPVPPASTASIPVPDALLSPPAAI